ncbi:manganese efflux pump MntP family protein [Denitrificimonas sp. JX-1]|uniref:Putative manganese efflux pump MntP n=1 Tax=Denitrificimonas halotolerans TaxID=3098930 RepID=A0ABU5GMG9_9GAMM|nr:manganese efflux pump MntP family protein [Denitrificimonas sp. JX-1]MDY7218076.1 manganese efflux pump MntP family protein [Denitrificimonas sp. JX-1]
MNPIALLLLAFAMSTDAFAAAVGKGASLKKASFSEALKMGLVFGLIEATTPVIGWLIGKSASSYVEAWAHWIAFSLLVALGMYMIYEGMKSDPETVEKPSSLSFLTVSLTAIGTSIDAMAVGVGLAFIHVNIWIAAALIGLATTFMVTLGVLLGRTIGSLLGHRAEVFGGLTLIAVGVWMLQGHF